MKGMQKVQPYVKVIQERNKGDRTKMNEELMDLYKKHRVNPLGGCLPMLLQIPVFIALYHALFFSIELRGAPFMLWITDLSLQDPYYVTPVIMGATMFLQQKLTPTVADPVQQKKVGNAVIRNRAKRMIREAFRCFKNVGAPGMDLVVISGKNLLSLPLPDLETKIANNLPSTQ